MAKEIYRCAPCNYEYEWLFFDSVPRSQQKPVPPCPVCAKELVMDAPPPIMDDYFYRCYGGDGGCALEVFVEFEMDKAPNTYKCPSCAQDMTLSVNPRRGVGILHGQGSNKGASIDVVIGRDAEQRWEKIHQRQGERNKIRQKTGEVGLTATGRNDYQPISKEQKQRRSDVLKSVETEGYKQKFDNAFESLAGKKKK
jgi:hypothetical protein